MGDDVEPHSLVGTVIAKRFEIITDVGEGKSAVVFKAKDMKRDDFVAIKALLKSSLNTRHRLRRVECECSIMMHLNHPYILSLDYVLEDTVFMYMIMPYAEGGDLLDYMLSNKPARLSEAVMKGIFYQTAQAISFAHRNFVCHRDLKPENILLSRDKKWVKVADWGFADRFSKTAMLQERCGTTLYAPPEMFVGQSYFGPEVDVWSLGVVLYTMKTGKFPFGGKRNEEIARNVVSSPVRFPSDISPELKDLITVMLSKRGTRRPSITQVLRHTWLEGVEEDLRSLAARQKREAAQRANESAQRHGEEDGAVEGELAKAPSGDTKVETEEEVGGGEAELPDGGGDAASMREPKESSPPEANAGGGG
eukprot:CAMPEP_0119145738 /NCGR_PEP_ID=MMETSP1310-20130426/37963_1 /TAXON_ID=464262 /ORGANISM="Genus nov. species nov., Strain RCC2339" /LENGTH=364 /DNA_ID=CAMNT_0007137577 /DNA_START=50 /DNA_END=1141 /DNA_ORIENTATION=+